MNLQDVQQYISSINEHSFKKIALSLFQYHFSQNPIYSAFCKALKINSRQITFVNQIPFLPVSFFKNHKITTHQFNPLTIFESSGTTGLETSRHYVSHIELYEKSFVEGFRYFFGDPQKYVILSLLPSYLERNNSSLVYMMDHLIRLTGNPVSGFYLHEHEKLYSTLSQLSISGKKTILLGVSFALLDFSEKYRMNFPELIIVETGGMKGRRKEMTRKELHYTLKNSFGVKTIHSEYGMTELLSQAWSHGNGKFQSPPWMKILIRDPNDPFSFLTAGKTGGINVVDFANAFSCPFIATDDLGMLNENGSFEIIGRFDIASVRGCNTMIY